MRTQSGLPYGLTVIALLGLALFGWTHSTPASAQDDAKPAAPAIAAPAGPMILAGPPAISASGDYVYILRGNTLFQLKAADLSVVTQKDLPAPGGAAPAGGPGAADTK